MVWAMGMLLAGKGSILVSAAQRRNNLAVGGLVILSVQPSYPCRAEHPRQEHLRAAGESLPALGPRRETVNKWDGRGHRNVASHRSIVAAYRAAASAWPDVGGNREACWKFGRDHTTLRDFRRCQFPPVFVAAFRRRSACEIDAGRPAQQPDVQKRDPTLGDLAAPAAILTGTALASRTATNSKRICAAVRLGWLSGKPQKRNMARRASRKTSMSFTLASTVWTRGVLASTPMSRCRR
jgi:hypothetical protein